MLTEGIAENQAENGDSNPPPRSNPLHAPAEHVKAYKRLLVLVKSKENIDKTLNFVSLKLHWQEKRLHQSTTVHLQSCIDFAIANKS